jgi:hypothetical protein
MKSALAAVSLVLVGACNGAIQHDSGDGGAGHGGAAGAAAGTAGGGAGAGGQPGTLGYVFQQSVNRDVDILFMVDNSSSMKPLQDKLTASFSAFTDVLKALPLPNIHLAVVSSDLGAGKYTAAEVPGCVHGGDQGRFQSAPRGACAGASLNENQSFISNVNGAANYTGDLSSVFGCIAALGQNGCGLEHQLGSVLRALGADGHGGPPSENAGFLRPNAFLVVVLVTNEDDCSAPLESAVFDPTSMTVSDPLGPLTSYRCNYVGHICAGGRPPLMSEATFTDCRPNDDGVLLRIADAVAGLKGLKPDPSKVLVAAIAGPPLPYVVKLGASGNSADPSQWPYISPSCRQPAPPAGDGTSGDPSVRLSQWVGAFGTNGVFESICNQSLSPALTHIAQMIGKKLGSPCLDGNLRDTDAVTAGVQPDCTAVSRSYDASGTRVDTPLSACAPGTAAPCWTTGTTPNCGTSPTFVVKNQDLTAAHVDVQVLCKTAP